MKIFPDFIFRPRYFGEAKVYDLLSSLPDDGGFVIHSLNLPDHAYKRWSEADFVLVRPSGLILLEVKGGTVTYADRVWHYGNAREQSITSTEGPARQALSAACALEKLLSERLDKPIHCRWGVAFPLCHFSQELVELPSERRADKVTCDDSATFLTWLESLPFEQRCPADFALDSEDLHEIRELLLPEFSAISSLSLAVQARKKDLLRLTDQQYGILDSLADNSRLLVSGGAGTGKTELAVLCAKAELAAGRKPVLVTSGKALYYALADRLESSGIMLSTGILPADFDTLIVDEGQDFAFGGRFEALFEALPGGLDQGRWRWFMDPNLQFLDTPPEAWCLERLAAGSATVNLKRNVRSTKEIVSCIRALLAADLGIAETDGFGIKVTFRNVTSVDDEVRQVVALLTDLLEEGVGPSEIALLDPRGSRGPVASALLRRRELPLQPFSPSETDFPEARILLADSRDFRGLESRMVILIDLDLLPNGRKAASLLYIAMSRATAALTLFVSPEGDQRLRGILAESLERNSE